MHRCLRIDEIVRFIASCLDDEQHRRSNLAHMALTCHAFYGPATTKLWSRLDGLKPLIQCLPADAIEVEDEHDREPGAIKIVRLPFGEEWSRFQFFARLVKELTIQATCYTKPQFSTHPDALDFLSKHHPPPMLPNLQHLEFCLWETPHHAAMFIQPSLRVVDFEPGTFEAADIFLRLVEDSTLKLEELTMSVESDVLAKIRSQLSDSICTMEHLIRLDFAQLPLNYDALLHVSSLSNLRSLSVKLTADNARARLSSSWGTFPSLASFELSTTLADAEISASLLRSFNGGNLASLTIVYRVKSPLTSIEQLLTAISQFKCLSECHIDFSHTDDFAWSGGRLQGHILAPLSRLPLMKYFKLRALPIDISAAGLRDLAVGWSHLRSLVFETNSGVHQGPTLDILDLPLLSEHCHDLKYLSVALRPLRRDWSWGPSTPLFEARMLQIFALQYSPIPRTAVCNVASFLARIFPRARMHTHLSLSHTIMQFTGDHVEITDSVRVMDEICSAKNDLLRPQEHAK